jgi:uncharacterized tellurite resistance protein B-like protein
MRHYPTNSPQAAARIVALALVADGHVSKAELDTLERLEIARQLGIKPLELHSILQGFCEDLLQVRHAQWGDAGQIEPELLSQLMAEIDDPNLRNTVLRLCVGVVQADGHIADGESVVLVTAVEQWGLRDQLLATTPT